MDDGPDGTPIASPPDPGSVSSSQDRAALRQRLAKPGSAVADLRALIACDADRHEIAEGRHAAELERIVAIHDAMAGLRTSDSAEALVLATPRALCEACGFSRAMISEVRGSVWDPKAVEIRDDCDPRADAFRAYVRNEQIPLEHLLLEADLVRRRVPVLVTDPAADPRTFEGIVQASRSGSFVAAPIMPTGRVIGFLHADRFGTDRACDEADRDALWVFAEHMGLIYERAVLLERLEDQRRRLAEAMDSAAVAIDEICRADVSLVRESPDTPNPVSRRRREGAASRLLTDREREVLDLLVGGASNATVARALVVSEATVKSHVQRILRKLRARTRAEAVAKYLRLSTSTDPGT